MLSLTRSRLTSIRILQSPRWCCAIREMNDRDVRAHFKRIIEDSREERIEKMKKLKKEEIDSRELRLIILGNGTPGGPTNIVISSPLRSYLFNCGEGTQKLCMEYRVRLPRITNLFLTSAKWKNIGGLPGFLLTSQSMGLPGIGFHGPKVFMKLLESTQRFIKVEYINLFHHEKEFFEDQVLRVQRVKLERSPPTMEGEGSLHEIFAYVCRGYDKPGRLVLEKCVDIGVPAGPLFSRLKAGHEITLDNGVVVKPSEVLEPSQPGPVFIVLECPSEDYVDSLLASKAIAAHQNLPGNDEDYLAACVVHMTPKAVYDSEKYQKFLGLFAENTKHLHLCDSNSSVVSTASFRRMAHLNLIHDEIFPMLPIPQETTLPPMTTFFLRKDTVRREEKFEVSIDKFFEEAQESENFVETRNELKKRLETIPRLDEREYPKVTFLGTGSAVPTKDRNVSGILVRPSENTAFLLDCGESTSNQLTHAFGRDKANEIIAQLKFVFISHIHADHHLGLAGILLRRQALEITDKLTVIAPAFMPPWLEQLSKEIESVECVYVNSKDLLNNGALSNEILSKLSVSEINTCFVDHVPESYGIRVNMNGYSLVYSGDTLPSENLVRLGKDCDLLIHEATMEDDLLSDARFKAHSTTSQAREIGRKMKAKFTLLTHFSQRYAKIPNIDESILADGKVGMAFDFMHVCPRSLHILPQIYPMLKCVFSGHYESLQERTQKYVDRSLLKKQQLYVKM